MRWVGCWFYMACWVEIPDRCDWWSVTPPVMHRGAPFHLNKYMSYHRFDEILAPLRYTNRQVQYEDGFFHMRQMEEAQNKKFLDEFNPSWINVLEEIMMEWYIKFAPGSMSFGRKPHPFGNDHYTICCGLTSIFCRSPMWQPAPPPPSTLG